MDNFEEAQTSITSIKKKDGIIDAYINSIIKKENTFNKLEESRATLVSNKPNKINKLENKKPSEVVIPKDNLDIYVLFGLG